MAGPRLHPCLALSPGSPVPLTMSSHLSRPDAHWSSQSPDGWGQLPGTSTLPSQGGGRHTASANSPANPQGSCPHNQNSPRAGELRDPHICGAEGPSPPPQTCQHPCHLSCPTLGAGSGLAGLRLNLHFGRMRVLWRRKPAPTLPGWAQETDAPCPRGGDPRRHPALPSQAALAYGRL